MQISLRTSALQRDKQKVTLKLSERLPFYIQGCCELDCEFSVKIVENYYLLNLHYQGMATINCQRCLQDFSHQINSSIELAICKTEEDADNLMSNYEAIVSSSETLDLVDVLTDELHLSCNEKHLDAKNCG